MGEMSRRFAAILAADVAQYSRLMERDSEATVQALRDCRRFFQGCVAAHGGREFGSVGDSLMAEFASPVEALRAAREIQSELARSVSSNDDSQRLQLRMGLHAGDVISDGENLFSDVVNTAARLQRVAQPGSVTLTIRSVCARRKRTPSTSTGAARLIFPVMRGTGTIEPERVLTMP